MKEKIIPKLIAAVIVVVMCIPIIMDVVGTKVIKTIEYADLDATVEGTYNYGFALVYVAPTEKEEQEAITEIKDLVESYSNVATGDKLQMYVINSSELSVSELKEIFGANAEEYGYVFAVNGEVLTTISGKLTNTELKSYIETYSANNFSSDLMSYKVAESADAFKKTIKQKNVVTMAVFGRDTCFYCNQFKVVYNVVAEENGLDIYYFNSDSYDKTEYDKVINKLGLKIPASCSSTGKEVALQEGFDTPLTLFTKNGKVIDCISGYVNKQTLITKLETVGMIEEKAN